VGDVGPWRPRGLAADWIAEWLTGGNPLGGWPPRAGGHRTARTRDIPVAAVPLPPRVDRWGRGRLHWPGVCGYPSASTRHL